MRYPYWLQPVVDVLERAEEALDNPLAKPVRVCFSVPPQHGKSTLLKHWLARLVGRFPEHRHAYCSYGAELAFPQSADIRDMVERVGVSLSKRARNDWSNADGGGIVASGIPGPLTGRPVDGIGLIDDPIRGRLDAESPVQREKVWAWYSGSFLSRIHNSTSIIVVATRWHEDDLTGRLTSGNNGDPFELINIPAVNEDGEALWPEHHSLENLAEKRRVSEYDWWSLYMGEPRSRGQRVFQLGHTCSVAGLPIQGRTGIGVDLAYTAKTYADYSVCVVLRLFEGKHYIMHVERMQEKAPDFIAALKRIGKQFRGAPMRWDGSTTERGAAEMVAALGLPELKGELAKGDPFVRAQEVAAAWNDGLIITPVDAPWTPHFLAEVHGFTGLGDKNDDQVVALASAYALIKHTPSGQVRTSGTRIAKSLKHAY